MDELGSAERPGAIMKSFRPAIRTTAVLLIVSGSFTALVAQTQIKPPNNRYTPEQDVALGREAAEEIRREYPIIQDEEIARYLTEKGELLVAHAPEALKHPAFEYSFTPVNLKEINAFALPGGPMFVHRGMFDAASAEGEVVGVMAHELAHVLLRHGTANASKAQNPWLQLGQLAGAIGGAMVGGATGSLISQGSQFGLGTLLLRYSRDFEKQADLLGAQIMARAGYDPRALARMFETIEKESKASGGSGTPQWLSSHPNPGNRTQYITKEAEALQMGALADESGFTMVRAEFATLPPAMTMAEMAKAKSSGGGNTARSLGTPGQPVSAPSAQYRTISAGGLFQVSIPDEWNAVNLQNAIRVAPTNGYGQINGQQVFTHGIEFGIAKPASRDLRGATGAWLNAIARSNPQLRMGGQQRDLTIAGRAAIGTPLLNPSPLGGLEHIAVYTMFLADGNMFYYFTIVPDGDAAAFQPAFERVAQSLRLMDAR
jgi:Zn-dependent protease with chaperone function